MFSFLDTFVNVIGYGQKSPDDPITLNREGQLVYPISQCNETYSTMSEKISDLEAYGIQRSVPNGFNNNMICSGTAFPGEHALHSVSACIDSENPRI